MPFIEYDSVTKVRGWSNGKERQTEGGTTSVQPATAYVDESCHMGVRQGSALSLKLFGIFFDGLHDYLLAWAPAIGVQLRSGLWVSSLVDAYNVVRNKAPFLDISWTAAPD